MKPGCILFFLFYSFTSQGQHAVLEPDNPSPRVGDQITLSLSLEKTDLTHIESKPDKTAKELKDIQLNQVGTGTLKLIRVMEDSGSVQIGPLKFEIGKEIYEAPAIHIQVRPSLPESLSEGFWVSAMKFNSFYYLIVEQRIPNTLKRDSRDPNTIKLDLNDIVFAELMIEKLEQHGLEYISGSVNTQNLNLNTGKSISNVAHKLSSYKFKPTSRFKGKIKVDRTYFSDLPKGTKVEDIYIH
jgi:hypothetical protein